MKRAILLLVPLLLMGDKPPAGELARIQSEPHPDKRAREALDHAEEALKEARKAYAKGDGAETAARLEELEQSVELADSSLKDTHKNPSRSPKHFKEAELRTRGLLRRLDGFRDEMSVADRAVVERAISAVQKIHDDLLDSIMGKRK